jgi:beta-N-acetylhexosaminidase
MLPFPEHMAAAFGGKSFVITRDPDDQEIRAVLDAAAKYEKIVLGTINAHLFRGQLALAKALAAAGKKLTVVALRNPYDIPELPECICKLAAYDYSTPAFRALEEVFRGGEASGILPVKL